MKSKKIKVCWFSAGVSSFVAGYLSEGVDKFIYIDIADQHQDSIRFVKDCERVLGKEIEIIKSEQYANVDEVVRAFGVIKNPFNQFAPCTNVLKKRVRKLWEQQHADFEITYVWGFDYDERHRAERLEETMFEFRHEFPLIDKMLTKQDAHAIADRLGIKRPLMYDMGYQNNNCIGCVKGGMWYWNQIRKDFPTVFASRAKLEKDIGASIIKGVYLDELEPDRGRKEDEISTDCGVMCYLNLDGEV
jgi:hypothetical protein